MARQPASSAQAAELLARARRLMDEWRERWQGASSQGYSEAEEALLDADGLLQELEGISARWRELSRPAPAAEAYARADEGLGDLIERFRELIDALDARDPERTRVVAQAVELSARRLAELEHAFD